MSILDTQAAGLAGINKAAFDASFNKIFNVEISERGQEKRVLPVIAKTSAEAIRTGLQTMTTTGSITARKA